MSIIVGATPIEKKPDFEAMTKKQLLEYAEKNGVEVSASMRKEDIIAKIEG